MHLSFQAEDKKTALPAGLSAAEKADAREEDELQAAEEVCGPLGPPEFLFPSSGEKLPLHPQLCKMASHPPHPAAVRWPLTPFPVSFSLLPHSVRLTMREHINNPWIALQRSAQTHQGSLRHWGPLTATSVPLPAAYSVIDDQDDRHGE